MLLANVEKALSERSAAAAAAAQNQSEKVSTPAPSFASSAENGLMGGNGGSADETALGSSEFESISAPSSGERISSGGNVTSDSLQKVSTPLQNKTFGQAEKHVNETDEFLNATVSSLVIIV